MPMLSLLIVTADASLAGSLRERLAQDHLLRDLVHLGDPEPRDGRAVAPCDERVPDVVVLDLDISLPGGGDSSGASGPPSATGTSGAPGGLAVLEQIRAKYPEVRCIALFDKEDHASRLAARRLGAFTVLAKPVDMDELALAIRRAARTSIEDALVALAFAETGDYDTVRAVMAPGALTPVPSMMDWNREGAAGLVLAAGLSEDTLERLARRLLTRRVRVDGVEGCAILPGILSQRQADVVVLNAEGQGGDCLSTLTAIKQRRPEVEVILLADAGDADALQDCMELGAFDCLLHPVDLDHLVVRLEDASAKARAASRGATALTEHEMA